jgi:hypothetical protein
MDQSSVTTNTNNNTPPTTQNEIKDGDNSNNNIHGDGPGICVEFSRAAKNGWGMCK